MQYRQLGNTEIKLSAIIMGTWQAGKSMWADIDDSESERAMRAALDAGITTFDTAEVYGDGHSEKIIARALSGLRDKVVLATKVFPRHYKHDQVIDACHRSLKHLNTDYIDLYQIHWPPGSFGMPKVSLKEIMEALVELKEQGKIRAIGVSNFDRTLMEEASQYGPIESLQPPYSLFWRMYEVEALPYCQEKGHTVLAYSPMAQGLLTGKFGPDHVFSKGDHRAGNRLFKPENFARVQTALSELRPIAGKHDITLGQLALAWIIAHPNTCAIAGARNAGQAIQNASAGDVQLSDEDMAAMDRIGRQVTDHLDDNPIQWA